MIASITHVIDQTISSLIVLGVQGVVTLVVEYYLCVV
jgi:hypothetical protein